MFSDTADCPDPRRHKPNQLSLSEDGLAHIKHFEGFRAEVYDDLDPSRDLTALYPLGTITIGYGHTGEHAILGTRIDEDRAEQILLDDLAPREKALKALVKVPLNQGEYDALVGFFYNVGEANFQRSTLLKRLNAGDYDGAAAEFIRWVYSKGRKLRGLEVRREAERAIFLGMPQYALVDLQDMAHQAEEMLAVGSAVQPDAIEERGVVKPLIKSKTLLAGASTVVAAVLPSLAGLDQRVQMIAVILLGGYVILNRVLEHRAREH